MSHRSQHDSTAREVLSNDIDESSRKRQRAADRRERMARLRAENEQEEDKLLGVDSRKGEDEPSSKRVKHSDRGDYDDSRKGADDDEDDEDDDDELAQMKRMMGISGFGSSKGTKVEDNHSTSARGAAAKNKARKYRQYMNRKNGFNRPLDQMD